MKNRDALTDSQYHSLLIFLIFIYWFCIWSKLFRHRKGTNRIIEFIKIFIDVIRNVFVLVKIKIVLEYLILEIHYCRTQYKLSIRHLKIWLYAIVQLFKYICDMRNLWIYLLRIKKKYFWNVYIISDHSVTYVNLELTWIQVGSHIWR